MSSSRRRSAEMMKRIHETGVIPSMILYGNQICKTRANRAVIFYIFQSKVLSRQTFLVHYHPLDIRNI